MKPRDFQAWHLIEAATPPELLVQVLLHVLLHPDKPLPPDLQRALGRAWGSPP